MPRWLLLLLTAACLLVGPGGRCAMAAGPANAPTPHRSCCDPDPTGHGVPTVPCSTMACCVLFAPAVPRIVLVTPAACGDAAPVDVQVPDTHAVRPPTPPPRAAGIA